MIKRKMQIFLLLFLQGVILYARNKSSDVERIIQREMKEQGIPGLQIAIVQHGNIVLSQSYGMANLQDSIKVDDLTIFPINSCTKVFTGVAIMQLVEENKIELNAPISEYLDSLPESWRQVTIKQLLTHISGLPDVLRLSDPSTHGLGRLGNEENVMEKLKTMPMDFPTGDQFSYNQTNYVLLGYLINKLTGMPFPEEFKKRQFQIVGMRNTVFGDSRDIIPHFAPTYSYRKTIEGIKLSGEKLINTYTEFPYFLRTGSGLNSTASEMGKWIIALQKGKLFKKQATLNTMWTRGTYNNGLPTQWALGWGITKFRAKHRAIGMSGGGRSAFLIYPDDDLAIVVLTNLGGSNPEDFIEEIAGCYDPDIAASDPVTTIRIHWRKYGIEKAIEKIKDKMGKEPEFKPDEVELNDWGYRLMGKGLIKEAIELFKLNVFLYPESWNVYDSYGESLLKNGQKEEAIEMYKKSVDLNPENENGKKIISRLL